MLPSEHKPVYDFLSVSKELLPPGVLTKPETVLPFRFKNMDKEFESYTGRMVAVRYVLRVGGWMVVCFTVMNDSTHSLSLSGR